MTKGQIQVELVFALPTRQVLREIWLPSGSTVDDVIARGDLASEFPEQAFDDMQAGIWGHPVGRDHVVRDGDRVELYRPLEMDPKEARRLKAGI
ncbi:MAG: RnfH family protein [Woeseiaceae bacterium]|nr:RnfH family protein [Woeseiaceae bacterium]